MRSMARWKVTAQFGLRPRIGSASAGAGRSFGDQLRIAYQLIAEVLAVLKDVESGFHQGGIGVEAGEKIGTRKKLFSRKCSKRSRLRAEIGVRDDRGQLGRPLIEKSGEVGGRDGRRVGHDRGGDPHPRARATCNTSASSANG